MRSLSPCMHFSALLPSRCLIEIRHQRVAPRSCRTGCTAYDADDQALSSPAPDDVVRCEIWARIVGQTAQGAAVQTQTEPSATSSGVREGHGE